MAKYMTEEEMRTGLLCSCLFRANDLRPDASVPVLLLQGVDDAAREPWNDILHGQCVGLGVNAHRDILAVLGHFTLVRIDDPYDDGAGTQIVLGLPTQGGASVVLAADLDHEFGNGFQISFGGLPDRELAIGDEYRVGPKDVVRVPSQDDPYLATADLAVSLSFALLY